MRILGKIPIFLWFLILTVIILGVGVWFVSSGKLDQKPDESKPMPVSTPVSGTVDYPIVGRDHIAQGTNGSGYNSNPPSSGPHWASPAAKGVYDTPIVDEQALHNMEHGYVWITFKNIGDDVEGKLKDIIAKDDWKIIMSPRDANETKIALVAWGRVLKMDDFDEGKVKDFINTYRNRGPEQTPE